MPNFDGTIDNRWRPDLESSRRRVQEELEDERDTATPSRELSFVPARRKAPEPYGPQTRALVREYQQLESIRHGSEVMAMLEKWRWIDGMHGPEQKQRFIEPIIEAVCRDPKKNEAHLVFLMTVFEPVRRSVSKTFMDVRGGLAAPVQDVKWSHTSEARMLDYVERERLYDVTREAALEAVFRYPAKSPKAFFPWLRGAIAFGALASLKGELPQMTFAASRATEAEAVQNALAGLDSTGEPAFGERAGMRRWRSSIDLRDVFETVDRLHHTDRVRTVCRSAIGRLSPAQRDVIDGYYFRESPVVQIAARRGVSESTVYTQKRQAEQHLLDDDRFFHLLHGLGRVRDQARARLIEAKYPGGLRPDGRRHVVISDAA